MVVRANSRRMRKTREYEIYNKIRKEQYGYVF